MFIENILSYIYYSIYVSLEYNGLFKTSNSWPTVISISGIIAAILMFMIIKFRELICVKIFNYDFYYYESWSCLDFVDLAIAICTSFCLEKYYIKREEKILTQMKERQKK